MEEYYNTNTPYTLYIADPIRQYHNVAKQSFRIEEVKNYFAFAFDYLMNSKLLYDKNELGNSSNIIFGLLLKVK